MGSVEIAFLELLGIWGLSSAAQRRVLRFL